MIEKLKTIARDENMIISDDVFNTITHICEGDARRSINTLQNTKYIPKTLNSDGTMNNNVVTKEDIYNITSFLDKSYFDKYWNDITTATIATISDIVMKITNTGYPLDYVLQCIEAKVFDTKILTDKQISMILIHIAKIERMITCGSDNYLQLLAVLTYINGICKNHRIEGPQIY
jgi:DNA polymerase III delta prime subunit